MAVFMLVLLTALLAAGVVASADDAGLAGWWPLRGDARDASGHGHHGAVYGVRFESEGPDAGAWFDGESAYIEAPPLHLGNDYLSICLWARIAPAGDQAVGTLLSQYDPTARRGVNFDLLRLTGVSNSQPNWQNLHFGVDDARLDPDWTYHGRPGGCVVPFAMAVWRDDLFVGTLQAGEDGQGRVYRLVGEEHWEDCGAPDRCNLVAALAVYRGRLYAGTSRYPMADSGVERPGNPQPGGHIYRYAGDGRWADCGALQNDVTGASDTLGGLTVYRGRLYATGWKPEGHGLYRYEGGTHWTYCGHPGRRVLNPFVYHGGLYMVSYDAPTVYRYDPEGGWTEPGLPITQMQEGGQSYSFASLDGRMHVSSWPQACVYRQEEDGRWSSCGRPGEERESMAMVVYNGKLYVGTLPSGRVYRYDGGRTWTPIGKQLDTGEGIYRRVWSMAVYRGRLFCGTLPSGGIYSLEAGRNVTLDRDLGAGWKHVAAVCDANRLRLYVNGRCVATRNLPVGECVQVGGEAPLRIGRGPNGFFHGHMRDVRVYTRALTAAQVRHLANQK